MATKKQQAIVPGSLVKVMGNVKLAGKKNYDDNFYDELAKVTAVQADSQLVDLILIDSENKKASTWIGNVSYVSEAPTYDVGDIVQLCPVKIVSMDIDEDHGVTYDVQFGDDEWDTTTVYQSQITQVLFKE